MPADLDVTVDASEVDALVDAGVRAITTGVRLIAEALATEHLPDEAPVGATGTLSRDWQLREGGEFSWVVFPDDDAFYAHMVARGTSAHGPRRARAMRIGDRFASFVGGITADPFHLRAQAQAEGRASDLLAEALAEEGVT